MKRILSVSYVTVAGMLCSIPAIGLGPGYSPRAWGIAIAILFLVAYGIAEHELKDHNWFWITKPLWWIAIGGVFVWGCGLAHHW